jgi:hypothetical protein
LLQVGLDKAEQALKVAKAINTITAAQSTGKPLLNDLALPGAELVCQQGIEVPDFPSPSTHTDVGTNDAGFVIPTQDGVCA